MIVHFCVRIEYFSPGGEILAVADPGLVEMLREGLRGEHTLTLVRSDRALTDCRPVSPISLQTVRQGEAEVGGAADKRRFRANIYLDLAAGGAARTVGSAAGCGSAPGRWRRCWSGTRAAR